jgi:hypothetical protein
MTYSKSINRTDDWGQQRPLVTEVGPAPPGVLCSSERNAPPGTDTTLLPLPPQRVDSALDATIIVW